jgi:flavin reductase ActVB
MSHYRCDTKAAVDQAAFRDAMARFPSGVTIVTTYDETGRPCGFTASSFCSVSADPPLVLVCLARSARSFPVFSRTVRFAVSVLGCDQTSLAMRFATRGADKFGTGGFIDTTTGALMVDRALVGLDCVKESQHHAGDHVIIVGRVEAVLVPDAGKRSPAVYVNRAFAELTG